MFKGLIAVGFFLNCNTLLYNSLKGKIPLYCEIWGHSPHRTAKQLIKKFCNISFAVTELLDSFEPQPDRWKKGKLDFFLFLFKHFPFLGFTQILPSELTEDAWKDLPFEGRKSALHQLHAYHLEVHRNKPSLFSAIMQITNSYLNDRLYLTSGN